MDVGALAIPQPEVRSMAVVCPLTKSWIHPAANSRNRVLLLRRSNDSSRAVNDPPQPLMVLLEVMSHKLLQRVSLVGEGIEKGSTVGFTRRSKK